MIAAPGGGCCTVFPFEAAIWLLEEQEELVGTNKRSINRCLACQPVVIGTFAHLRIVLCMTHNAWPCCDAAACCCCLTDPAERQ